jgi:hypothetical protein
MSSSVNSILRPFRRWVGPSWILGTARMWAMSFRRPMRPRQCSNNSRSVNKATDIGTELGGDSREWVGSSKSDTGVPIA